MTMPSLPLGFLSNLAMRIYDAIAKAPCIIDIRKQTFSPYLQFRIRNASALPVQIQVLGVEWQSAKARDFDTYTVPSDWFWQSDTAPTIAPGHASTWYELDINLIEGATKKGRITVEHSGSGMPTTKRFEAPLTPKQKRDLMRDV